MVPLGIYLFHSILFIYLFYYFIYLFYYFIYLFYYFIYLFYYFIYLFYYFIYLFYYFIYLFYYFIYLFYYFIYLFYYFIKFILIVNRMPVLTWQLMVCGEEGLNVHFSMFVCSIHLPNQIWIPLLPLLIEDMRMINVDSMSNV